MGNCQAIDNATLVIQHPCGRADKLYWPVTAAEVMKTNPGHYVALLLTTTTISPSTTTAAAITTTAAKPATDHKSNNTVRITRIKLLRPTDTLILGRVYRLITNQEVMKGLRARKYSKMKKDLPEFVDRPQRPEQPQKLGSDFRAAASTEPEVEKNKLEQKHEKHRSRPWQPSLKSISEASS